MGGTIVKGESYTDGAARKLEQETGLVAQFKLVGFERRQLFKEDKLFSDVLFPICYASTYESELMDLTDFSAWGYAKLRPKKHGRLQKKKPGFNYMVPSEQFRALFK